jgi:polysaccharide export outer membrane protein
MQVKKQQDELTRKLEKLDDQRRLDLLRELQDTSVKLNEIREKLQSVGEKLQYTAMVRSQLARGAGNKRRLPSLEKARKGRIGLSQAKIRSCSRVTRLRSRCDTRTVLTRLSEG